MSKFEAIYDKIFKNLYLLIPLLQFLLLESFSNKILMNSGPFLINIAIYYAVFLFLQVVFNRVGVSIIITSVLWGGIGIVNAMLLQFRQTPILPWDLLSVKTALSVSSGYKLNFTPRIIICLLCFALLILTGIYCVREKAFKITRKRLITSLVSLLLSIILIFIVPFEGLGRYIPINEVNFQPDYQFSSNGFAFSFLRALKDTKIEKPSGYDEEKERKILKDAENITETDKKPNIIVIMNEAFSDLTILDDQLKTNEEVMPYISSLDKNVIKGNTVVSVRGGNTANSEFEFLTSMPYTFYPVGSVPYQQFIKGNIFSLPNYLKQFNYDTYAFHPAQGVNWNRDSVYPHLGFDNCIFAENLHETKVENPITYRNMISDKTTYDYLIKHYENRDKNKNFFEFCVTLQNHGGYGEDMSAGFVPDIYAKNYNSDSLNIYLSLINKSDDAFKYLTEYFTDKEPTIILMFGDHQPSDEVTGCLKNSSSDIDKYTVPYVLWANYDIDTSVNYKTTSLNYLSLLLYKKAGIDINNEFYNKISDFQSNYPVISSHGIIDNSGQLFDYNKIKNNSIILDYRRLNYKLIEGKED